MSDIKEIYYTHEDTYKTSYTAEISASDVQKNNHILLEIDDRPRREVVRSVIRSGSKITMITEFDSEFSRTEFQPDQTVTLLPGALTEY